MPVRTRQPTPEDLERLARIAEGGAGSKAQPGIKSVVASCLPVIAQLRQNGHTWAAVARKLAERGVLFEEAPQDQPVGPPSKGVRRLSPVMGPDDISDRERWRPVRTSTLRAAAWAVNRADGDRYDLRA